MVSEAAIKAASDLPTLEAKVRAFIVTARLKAQGGLTIAELSELVVALLQIAIDAVDSFPVDGAAKRAYVLEAVGLLFDAVADYCVPTLAYPIWLIVKPAVRSLVLLAASGAIESLLPAVRVSTR